MVFRTDGSTEASRHNFDVAWAMAVILEEGESLLVRKPSGLATQGHTGGELTPAGSSAHDALVYFSERALGRIGCPDEEPGASEVTLTSGRRLLRRLSHEEYARTVVTLLGDPVPSLVDLASDDVIDGYANNADALWVSPLLADQYSEQAETLAAIVMERRSRWSECDVLESGTALCAQAFLEAFGLQCFRRPLTDAELQRYFDLWYTIATEDGYDEGLSWVVTAMLQSPHFLYRPELGSYDGEHFVLGPYELASELSYTLTGTMPDQVLLGAAGSGLLSEPATLRGHAERLMTGLEVRENVWAFVRAWLGLDQLDTVARSPEVYPELTAAIRESMLGQTRRTVEGVFSADGSFVDLMTGNQTWVTNALASYYGISHPTGERDEQGFGVVDIPTHMAGGLLSQGSVLTTHAKPSGSSPIHRGVLVRERFLCQDLPPPPPNLNTSPPAMDPTKSTRERYAEHSTNVACSSCHNLIDPIGFGFEHFDGIGRWRAQDGVHAIDDSGEIMGAVSTNGTFDGLAELTDILAQSDEVRRCFIRHWSQYLYGLHDQAELESTIATLASSMRPLQATLMDFVDAPHFIKRIGAEDASIDAWQDIPATSDTLTLLAGRDEPSLGSGSGSSAPQGLEVSTVEDSRWNSGACSSVTVTNTGDAAVDWEVDIEVEGSVESMWNAEVVTTNGNLLRVRGVSWNATLMLGQSAGFGFCVSF